MNESTYRNGELPEVGDIVQVNPFYTHALLEEGSEHVISKVERGWVYLMLVPYSAYPVGFIPNRFNLIRRAHKGDLRVEADPDPKREAQEPTWSEDTVFILSCRKSGAEIKVECGVIEEGEYTFSPEMARALSALWLRAAELAEGQSE